MRIIDSVVAAFGGGWGWGGCFVSVMPVWECVTCRAQHSMRKIQRSKCTGWRACNNDCVNGHVRKVLVHGVYNIIILAEASGSMCGEYSVCKSINKSITFSQCTHIYSVAASFKNYTAVGREYVMAPQYLLIYSLISRKHSNNPILQTSRYFLKKA